MQAESLSAQGVTVSAGSVVSSGVLGMLLIAASLARSARDCVSDTLWFCILLPLAFWALLKYSDFVTISLFSCYGSLGAPNASNKLSTLAYQFSVMLIP